MAHILVLALSTTAFKDAFYFNSPFITFNMCHVRLPLQELWKPQEKSQQLRVQQF